MAQGASGHLTSHLCLLIIKASSGKDKFMPALPATHCSTKQVLETPKQATKPAI